MYKRQVLDGKHDDLPESAFFLKGSIDQVVEAAKGSSKERHDEAEEEQQDTQSTSSTGTGQDAEDAS